jgi:hypothetical protein
LGWYKLVCGNSDKAHKMNWLDKISKIIQTISIIAIFIFLFASCDPGSNIKYEIWNKTSKPIKVEYHFVFTTDNDSTIHETIINPNEIKTINESSQLGYAEHFDDSHDSIYLYSMGIIQDSLIATRNFKDKKNWSFRTEDKLRGIYRLTIEQNNFIL